MTIRAGDSLLFTAGVGATGTLHIAVMDGSNQVCQTREGVTGEKFPVRFDQGGTFTVIASVDGISVGSLIVHVVYIDFDGPVACQVGYRREKGVAVYGPTDQVFFTAKDPALLEVSVKGVTSYGVRLYLKALGRGTPVVQARLGSATGPILAEQELDEFILDTSAVQHLVVNGETDTANSIVTMSPWIPNLNINFAMYAHYSTFAGGATAYTLNTSDQTAVDINGDPAIDLLVDPATGETQAVMHVDIEMPPAESSYCFSASFDQHSKYGTLVSYPVNCNGSSCRWTMTEAYWGVNEITAYPNLNLKYVIAKCTEGHNRHHGVVSAENGFDVTNTSGLDMVCVKGNHYSFLVSKSQVKPRGRYDLMMSSSNPGTPGTPFTKLIVYKVVLNQCDASWDPKGQGADEADRLTKITASTSPSAVPGRFKFTLYEVSNEPGYCMNAPAIVPSSGPDSILWKDLQCLDPQSGFNVSGSNKEEATTVLNNLLTASVIIKSYDYGAYGKIKVEFAANDGSCYTCMGEGELGNLWTPIPDDTDGNHIRDTWAHNAGSSTDDTDASLNNTGKGDGLTRYEEYRGVDINHDGKISPDERLNPDRKDLFVQGIGFGGADFPVFSYGTAFNEAAIDVHEFLGAVGTDDRNIDVLVETCLDQGGHIRRIGVQKWSWSQKGQSSGGTITAYGAPEINKKACNFYFTDKPYKDGKTWSAVGQWNAPKNGVLDPVTKVEDSNDDGELNANENDGATLTPLPPPDDGDNELDGDYVVATSGGGWDWNQDLNPCDINNNGKVELGISIAMPVNAGDEYSKEQVVRHTATHEIGHAVGIRGTIAGHCDDETCLMYLAGNNWKRDGHFCTDCRGMIKIHNN